MAIRDKIENLTFWITLIFSVALAYFVYLSWQKLSEFLGSGWGIWSIMGIIVLIGILSGYLGIKKLVEEFT